MHASSAALALLTFPLRYPVLSLAMDADSRDDPARLNPGDSMQPLLEGPPPSQLQVSAALASRVGCGLVFWLRVHMVMARSVTSGCAAVASSAPTGVRAAGQYLTVLDDVRLAVMFLAGLACLIKRDFIL